MEIPLVSLKEGENATVAGFRGGRGFARKLRTIGIREGKTITVVARHPFSGPIVVRVDDRETTLGRGMARKILVDVER